ncbi:MAG: hypothetical protein WBC01_12360 [Solirubrobacterales bacterium]
MQAGSRIRVGGGVVPLLCAAMLSVPAAAAAGSQGDVSFEIERGTAGGYEFKLYAAEFFGEQDVALDIRRGDRTQGHGRRVRTSYLPLPAPASRVTVSGSRINGRLGSRGSVGMRFHARTRSVKRLGCARRIVRRGVLRGHLRFRGEAGYVKILAHRLKAKRVRIARQGCGRTGERRRPPPVLLVACRRNSLFGARQFPRGRTDFAAIDFGKIHRGLLSVTFALVSGSAERFTYADDLGSASVEPPRPFRGVGNFSRDSGAGRIVGDLRASFPATKRIRFTPASGRLVRRKGVDCESPGFDRATTRPAEARRRLLRAIGVDWLGVR